MFFNTIQILRCTTLKVVLDYLGNTGDIMQIFAGPEDRDVAWFWASDTGSLAIFKIDLLILLESSIPIKKKYYTFLPSEQTLVKIQFFSVYTDLAPTFMSLPKTSSIPQTQ